MELMQWLVCVLDRFVLYNFLNTFLPRKRSERTFILISYLILSGSVLYLINLYGNPRWNLVGSVLTLMITILLLFRTDIKRLIFYSFIICVVAMIAEFAVYTAYTSILKVPANQSIQTPWVDMMGVMARYVAFVIIGKNIKVDESERKYIFWLRFLYPAITLLLILKIYQIISLTEVKAYGIEWICVLLMIATIVSFKIIDDMADLIRNNERYKKAIAENSLNLDRYEELEKEENAWKKREHDLAKYLSAIGGLAEEKKDNEIIEVLEGMQIEIKSLRKTQYIENGVINALLRVKLSEAESKGISVDFYAEPNLGISTFEIADLIAIIGNQLDNAIEAAQLCSEKKKIWARYYCTDDRKIVFEMENSYERDMYKWKVIEKAREKGGVHHGLGMRIIDETVRRYGGFYGVEKADNYFRSVIVLPREKIA